MMASVATNLSLSDWTNDAALSKWFDHLNNVDAPVPRQNLKVALQFFQNSMPGLPANMALNFMLATDLSKPVKAVQLTSRDNLIAFRSPGESPFKLFYARTGASKHNSGINPAGRTAVRFRVKLPCPALESFTTGAIDVWSVPASGQLTTIAPRAGKRGVMAMGGGLQLIIPNADRNLEVV